MWMEAAMFRVVGGMQDICHHHQPRNNGVKASAREYLCTEGGNNCYDSCLGIGPRQICEHLYRLKVCLQGRTWSNLEGKRIIKLSGQNIKHAEEVLKLLEAVQLPEKVVIMHMKAHLRVSSELERGNELADGKAKQVAKTKVNIEGALILDGRISLEGKPEYTKEGQKLILDWEGLYNKEGWAHTPQGKLNYFFLPNMAFGKRRT